MTLTVEQLEMTTKTVEYFEIIATTSARRLNISHKFTQQELEYINTKEKKLGDVRMRPHSHSNTYRQNRTLTHTHVVSSQSHAVSDKHTSIFSGITTSKNEKRLF